MKHNCKTLLPAAIVAATAVTLLAVPAMAQPNGSYGIPGRAPYVTHESADGPLYYHRMQRNGTGALPDSERDTHDNR
jgi:hypothetical protein